MGKECDLFFFARTEVLESGGGEHGGTGQQPAANQSPVSGTKAQGTREHDAAALGGLQLDPGTLNEGLAGYLTIPCQICHVQGRPLTHVSNPHWDKRVGTGAWLRPCSIVTPTCPFYVPLKQCSRKNPGVHWTIGIGSRDSSILLANTLEQPRADFSASTRSTLTKLIAAPRRPARRKPLIGRPNKREPCSI